MNHSKYDKKYVCAASIIKLLDDCALRVSDDSILFVRVSTSRALITNSTHRKKRKWNNRTYLKVYMNSEETKKDRKKVIRMRYEQREAWLIIP